MRASVLAVTCTALLLVVAAGCNDDDCPTCHVSTGSATMANIWPHADGNTWTYTGTTTELSLPDSADAIGNDLPTMEEAHGALATLPDGTVLDHAEFTYHLWFDGDITTGPGVTAQNLKSQVSWPATSKAASPAIGASAGDPLLQLIARARPDLAPALRDRYGLADKAVGLGPMPFLLAGYAFAYEDSGYFGYGELDTLHSWTYLQGGLEPGTSFTLPLVPALADDLWLHGRMWSVGDVTVGGRTFADAVECFYLVDLGQQMVVDENGTLLGIYHPWLAGTVVYAPDVGPIASRERGVLGPDGTLENVQTVQIVDTVLEFADATTADQGP